LRLTQPIEEFRPSDELFGGFGELLVTW